MEVCSLSREVILRISALNLYPLDYGAAFAFSILRYPQPSGLALRLAVLNRSWLRRTTGLPRSG